MSRLHATQLPVMLALLACILLAAGVSGQGYNPPPNVVMGSTNKQQTLAKLLASSSGFVKQWRAKTSCRSGQAAMCAPAGSSQAEQQAALMLAMSPSEFSSTRLEDTGFVRVIADAEDQRDCNTCTAMAVVAAAQAAVATVLQIDVNSVLLSSQDLFFCSQDPRSCSAGWSFIPGAVASLVQRQQLLSRECLDYNPSTDPFADTAAQCTAPRKCNKFNDYASQGKFGSQQVTNIWDAQRYIRQYGAVVTSYQVMSDLRPFFSKPGNAQKVYSPSPGATFVENHAVVLVGYKNEDKGGGFWVALNSWGPDWANSGTFKVAYGCCGILADAYAITWQPKDASAVPTLQPRASAPNNCFYYTAKKGDYLSRIAQRGGVRLEQFLLDNIGAIDDLGQTLVGKKLLVCPSANRGTAATVASPAAGPAPAAATSSGCASNKVYVVKSNDSLWQISIDHDTTLEALLAVNAKITNPNLIFPGQKICLP